MVPWMHMPSVLGFDQQAADHGVVAPWLEADGTAKVVMLGIQLGRTLAEWAVPEIGPAIDNNAGGFANGVGIDNFNRKSAHRGIS